MIELLMRWSSINSHSRNQEGLNAMRDELIAAFSPLATETSILENGLLSFKRNVPDKKKILLIGHYDTVYPKEQNFPVEIRGDYLHGPGVADMKGGLVIILYALKSLKDQFSWEVLLNPDEEIGSLTSMPQMMERAKDYEMCFIFEPAMPDGSLVDTRPSSSTYRLTATGVEAHAGRNPEGGKSAINALCELIYNLSFLHDPKRGILFNVGVIEGGTAVNVVSAKASALFNLRAKTDQDYKDAFVVLEDLIEETFKKHATPITLEQISYRPQKLLSSKTKLLMQHFALVYGTSFGPSRGVCDSNNLSQIGLPIIDSLGPIGFDLHSPNERILIQSLEHRLNMFLRAIQTLG